MTPSEELSLIEKVRAGDADAFEPLVVANQNKVYSLALKLLKNSDDALDASQEAFLKAYTNIAGFRADSRFSVWLYRLTYNVCIDYLRKRNRESTIPLTVEDDEGEMAELEIPDERSSPEREFEKHELRALINEGLSTLSEEHRQILIMREISDMSYTDIAETLSINVGTVKSRLARARASLAVFLRTHGTNGISTRQKIEER